MDRSKKAGAKLPVFPLVFAVYPVLALAAHNQGEYTLPDLAAACAFCVLVAGACYAAALSILPQRRHPGNAALTTTVVVAWLFLSPAFELSLVGIIRENSRWGPLFRFRVAALVTLLGVVFIATWLIRSEREHPGLLRFARILSVVLLLSSGGLVAWSSAQNRNAGLSTPAQKSKLSLGSPHPSDPDIYLLILDQYANAATLRTYLDFDNSAFETQLHALGFQIPTAVHSNYAWTVLSLASILNASYVDSLGASIRQDGSSVEGLYSAIRSNAVATSLKRRGYRYFLFPSREFPGTFTSPLADEVASIHSASIGRQWIAHSPLLFHMVSGNSVARIVGRLGWGVRVPDYDLQLATELGSPLPGSAPIFVVAHFMLTHDPFRFDAACNQSSTYAFAPAQSREAYLASLQCTNRMLSELLPKLLSNRSRPIVILLQGDHGTQTQMRIGPASEVSRAAASERFGAFGAYLLPKATAPLPDTLAAVNLFPTVFNRVFSTNIPLEPDRQYFSTLSKPFSFLQISQLETTSDGKFPSRSR